MLNEIRADLIRLQQLEEITAHAESDYEMEPENKDCEDTFDRAYKNEFAMYKKVSMEIAVFAGIDKSTARKLVRTKRKELISILGIKVL